MKFRCSVLLLLILLVSCKREVVDGITYTPPGPNAGENVTFSVSAGGSNCDYHWDFGDGHSTTTQVNSTSHSFSNNGVYNVSVNVEQNGTIIAGHSASISVN